MDPPADAGRGGLLIAWWAVACARPTVPEPAPEVVPAPVAEPSAVSTEGGRYRVALTRGGPGELVLRVTTAAGEPVPGAHVAVVLDGEGMLVQPGEGVGGVYFTKAPEGWRPAPNATGLAHVAVDGSAGLDRGVLPLPP